MNKYKKVKVAKKLTRKNLRTHIVSVILLVVFCLGVVLPQSINQGVDWVNAKSNLGLPKLPDAGFNLGLDLQGGAHLVYQADTSVVEAGDRADAVEGVRDVIERRVRGGLGVGEPMVQTTKVGKDYRIIVELPGVESVTSAIKMIGETPTLEFKEESQEPARALTDAERTEMNTFNATAEETATKALAEAKKTGADFSALVTQYSEDIDVIKEGGGSLGYLDGVVYPDIYKWASTAEEGEIGNTFLTTIGGYNIVKKGATKDGGEEISASHILICYKDADRCESDKYATKEDAKKKADELKTQATPSNFANLAKSNSTEPGADTSAGDLGWFTKGVMVPTFETEVFKISTGTISDVIETDFGYHIIYKKDQRIQKTYQVSRILVKTKSAIDMVPPTDQWKSTGLSGQQLKRAEVVQDPQSSQIQVSLNFDSEGTKLFADITKKNVGKKVAIFLDGQPISTPNVNEQISSGRAVITGGFSLKEAQLLARRLNSGALPVPIELISQQSVDATLGADSLVKSFNAALFGLMLVIIFMILYYRIPGIVSAVALGIYAVITLAIFKLVGVTLTLSGIAGLILSLGMAVDANILIFERLREELKSKRSLRASIEDAFKRAWTSIRDGNITTLISAVFLIWFGTGFVQGFAVTLAIGVLSSMFTAIIMTKAIMRFTSYWFAEDGNRLFLGFKKRNNK